jgi:hypothetical protein
MPKVKLEPVPEHIVIPDTNILWDKDKTNSVSEEFDQFWSKNSDLIPLRLYIPEVVIGELQFQQATSAIKLADTASDNISNLSKITKGKYKISIDHSKIRSQVGDKIKKWLAGHSGQIIKTPVSTINWDHLIENAIWRNPPFTFDHKDKANEKGFRDALILETVCQACDIRKGDPSNIVFICNDNLLRNAVSSRQKHNGSLLLFESIPDFEGYIKLTQQSLTDKFVKSIQVHAKAKFYSPDDKSSIYYRDNIRRDIIRTFAEDLSSVLTQPKPTSLLGESTPSGWNLLDQRWWINATIFDELIRPREYHWITRITLARLLQPQSLGAGLSLILSMRREEIHIMGFDVKWKARVTSNGRFHDIKVTDIVKAEARQEISTDELLNKWRLERNRSSSLLDSPDL